MVRPRAVLLGVLVAAAAALVPLHALSEDQAVPEQPPGTVPAELLREDLRTLWDAFDEGHAGLDRYVPRETTKQAFDRAMAGLTAPVGPLEAYRTVQALVAGIKDGHTRVLPSDAVVQALAARPAFFPFEVRFVGQRAYLFRNLSAQRAIRDGSEILAINGVPIADVRLRLASLVSADADVATRPLRLLERPQMFGELLAVVYGARSSFRVRYRPGSEAGTAAGSTRIKAADREADVGAINGADIDRIRRERYPSTGGTPRRYEIAYRDGAAVMTIRGFGDDNAPGAPTFRAFLQQAFRDLEAKHVGRLVIDLRGNGGGRDEYGRLLFAHFMEQPFTYYRALEVKKDRFDFARDGSGGGPWWRAADLRKNARGWYDLLTHPNVGTMPPEAPRFTGRTAIIVDGASFSTTGETTSLFHFHKKAVFVGEECGAGYYGNTSGAMQVLTLPRSGLRVAVPLVRYTLAVEGYPPNRGILPEVAVSPTIDDLLAGRDVVMEKALAALNGPDGRLPGAECPRSEVGNRRPWVAVVRFDADHGRDPRETVANGRPEASPAAAVDDGHLREPRADRAIDEGRERRQRLGDGHAVEID